MLGKYSLNISCSYDVVQGAPEKSLDNALQADAGREILKHLAMMETTMNDNSKSLSNIRQAVEAVVTSAKGYCLFIDLSELRALSF